MLAVVCPSEIISCGNVMLLNHSNSTLLRYDDDDDDDDDDNNNNNDPAIGQKASGEQWRYSSSLS
jgi:hypothetical protein